MCNVACLRQLERDWKTVQEVIFFHLWRRLPRSPAHSAAVSCLLLLSQQGPITIIVYLSPLLLLWSFPLNWVFSKDSTLQKTGRGVVQQLIQAATFSRTTGALECLSGTVSDTEVFRFTSLQDNISSFPSRSVMPIQSKCPFRSGLAMQFPRQNHIISYNIISVFVSLIIKINEEKIIFVYSAMPKKSPIHNIHNC